jgi:putative peptidoglycan lipid II flippase
MRELIKNGTSLLSRRQNSIMSAALVIMATYGVSHLMGLFKTRLLISVFFGARASLLDVYYAAFVIPDTLFQLLVVGSLSAAFIPVFTRLLTQNEDEAWRVAGISLNLTLVVFFVLSSLIFIFARPLSQLIAPGFDPDQITIMVSLLRIMLVSQIFFCISGFLTGIIQSHQRFVVPALAPIMYNLGIILGTLFLSPFIGIYGPAIGVVVGAVLHMTIQVPMAFRLGFRPIFSLNTNHRGVLEIIRLIPPRALTLGIDQIEQFIAVIFSSLLLPGSLTLFNVAKLLYALPTSLFGVTIGQAALPALSKLSAESDRKSFRQTLVESLLQIVYLSLPLAIMFIVLRIPIVRLIFGAKSFPWLATLTTGKLLAILCLSSSFAASSQLLVRGFYALHDTKTPLFVGLGGAVLDISLSILFINFFHAGVLGLAWGISFTSVIETTVLLFLLGFKIKIDKWAFSKFSISFLKMLVTGLATGFSLWIPMRLLDQFVFDTTRTVPLIALTAITATIGLFVYFLFSYLFRVDQLKYLFALMAKIKNFKFPSSPPKEVLIVSAPDQN